MKTVKFSKIVLILAILIILGGTMGVSALPGEASKAAAEVAAAGVVEGAVAPAITASAGSVVHAASCSQEDVQNAIDAASDGDFVMVPVGSCTWTTPPGDDSVPAIHIDGKAITLQGAGIGQTIITNATGTGWNNFVIRVDGLQGKPFRITGFTFVDPGNNSVIAILGDCEAWRVDHCEFEANGKANGDTTDAIEASGYTRGVVDHCHFKNSRVVVRDGGLGHDSWKRPLGLGTADAVYVEDNVFIRDIGGNSMDSGDGGRYVFRYNRVTNSRCEAHSLQNASADGTSFARATRSYEIYHNYFTTLDNGTESNWVAVFVRGGTGVIFSNRVVNASGPSYNVFGGVDNKRSMQTFPAPLGQCDGYNPLDGNTLPTETHHGYPCLDQIGRSTDHGPGDDRLPQAHEPLYAWDNTMDGQLEAISAHNDPYDRRHIQEGRDFFNAPKPGYTPYVYPHPLTQELNLYGTPADQTIHLNWEVHASLPPTSTWRIEYEGTPGDQPSLITGIISPTRAYSLTGLANFEWYTVTLKAMADTTVVLSDTARLMPTNIFVYLPVVSKEN